METGVITLATTTQRRRRGASYTISDALTSVYDLGDVFTIILATYTGPKGSNDFYTIDAINRFVKRIGFVSFKIQFWVIIIVDINYVKRYFNKQTLY